jgi:hypothetical protein
VVAVSLVHAKEDDRFDLGAYQGLQQRIIHFGIHAAGDPDHRPGHAFEGKPGRIDVRCHGIVDEFNAMNIGYGFNPELKVLEITKTFLYEITPDIPDTFRNGGCHGAADTRVSL